jgi:aspartyl-tRNA(Asn)/glutamyl-tRNA(Gln) amidotransferase subunit C
MLSLEQIHRIARLARLELSAAEADAMCEQLNSILAMVGEMSAVDTAGIAPMSHPQEVTQRLREDRVTGTSERELYHSLAPEVEDGLYLVPRVIE